MNRKRSTLAVIAILLIVAACARPLIGPPGPKPTPTPEAMYTIYVPTVDTEPSRGIGTGTGCSLGTQGGPWDSDHQFPRIIATNGDYAVSDSNATNLSAVARYDGVLWTYDWPTYQNYTPAPSVTTPFAYVRALNAGTKFIATNHSYSVPNSYCHISATYPHRCAIVTAQTTADGYTAAGDGWMARDRTGTILSSGITPPEYYVNWSDLDPDSSPSDPHYWGEWFGNYIVDEVNDDVCSGSPCWDAYYFEAMGIPHGRQNFAKIDADENGVTDLIQGAWDKCTVDQHQLDGYNAMYDILATGGIAVAGGEGGMDAGLTGADSAPYTLGHATAAFNGDFPRSTWPDCSVGPHDYSGGATVPGGNLWHYNMRQALTWEDDGSLVVNMAGEDLFGAGGDSYYQAYVSDWNQQQRLVVGSTLLINGYSIPHQDQIPPSYPCDECLVSGAGASTTAIADGGWLGCPLGPARNTTNDKTLREVLADSELLSGRIWWRAFDNGLVVVNASETDDVTVDIGTGWKRIQASGAEGGDTTHNDGTAVAGGTLTIDAYDAYVLVRDTAPVGTAVPGATNTPTRTATPTHTPGPSPTPTPTSAAFATDTPEPLTCTGLPSSGTAILRNRSGAVVETVVYTSSNSKSFGAVNWMTPPALATDDSPLRVWATGTPNPGTAATAVP